jgi:hypothetical protein
MEANYKKDIYFATYYINSYFNVVEGRVFKFYFQNFPRDAIMKESVETVNT